MNRAATVEMASCDGCGHRAPAATLHVTWAHGIEGNACLRCQRCLHCYHQDEPCATCRAEADEAERDCLEEAAS